MKPTPEIWISLACIAGAVLLFVFDKTEPAMLLLGAGGYGGVRGAQSAVAARNK